MTYLSSTNVSKEEWKQGREADLIQADRYSKLAERRMFERHSEYARVNFNVTVALAVGVILSIVGGIFWW